MKLTLNGQDIREDKVHFDPNQQTAAEPFDLDNYQNWDFGKLNILFGTDSQPFTMFIDQKGKHHVGGEVQHQSAQPPIGHSTQR